MSRLNVKADEDYTGHRDFISVAEFYLCLIDIFFGQHQMLDTEMLDKDGQGRNNQIKQSNVCDQGFLAPAPVHKNGMIPTKNKFVVE